MNTAAMKKRLGFHHMSLTAFTVATILSACNTAQPAPNPNEPFKITNVSTYQDTPRGVRRSSVTGATLAPVGLIIDFNRPVDRTTAERAINFFPAEFSTANNPSTASMVQLTSMCNGLWRVRNTNQALISYSWDVSGSAEKGAGTVVGALVGSAGTFPGESFFQSTLGPKTVRVFVNGKQTAKATNPAACAAPLYDFGWNANSTQVTVAWRNPDPRWVGSAGRTLVVSTSLREAGSTAPVLFEPHIRSVQIVTAGQSIYWGWLTPGGRFDSPIGVSVGAPEGAINEADWVYVQPIDSSFNPNDFKGYGDWPTVGSFYKIGSEKSGGWFSNLFTPFEISLPVPPGIEINDLTISALVPSDLAPISEAGPETYWEIAGSPIRDLVNRRISINIEYLPQEGMIFSLRKTSSSQSSAGNNGFYISCELLAGSYRNYPCNNISNQVLDAANESYDRYVNDLPLIISNQNSDESPLISKKILIRPTGTGACNSLTAAYYPITIADNSLPSINVCITSSGNSTKPSDYMNTIKHEIFHSVQSKLLRLSGMRLTSHLAYNHLWIIEGTANAAVNSTSLKMNHRPGVPIDWPRVVSRSIFDSPYYLDSKDLPQNPQLSYQMQDFWVFLGRRNNRGIDYLKRIFTYHYDDFITDVNFLIQNDLGYQDGLPQAYWDWVNEQTIKHFYEPRVGIYSTLPCSLGLLSTRTDSNIVEITHGVNGPLYSFEIPSLETLIVRIKGFGLVRSIPNPYGIAFYGNDPWSYPDPVLKYQVYKLPDPSNNCLSLTSSSPTFTDINTSTELIILISNPDLDPANRRRIMIGAF